MTFRKAQRKNAKLRLALFGPSGSGKTYSSLQIAQGLGEKVVLIDTERGSGELYSHLCDYDVADIQPPFTPEKYINLIREAEAAGYGTIIIDSLSHSWSGEGGLLDIHDKATQASRSKNSFMAWREVTPQHNRLIDTILQSSAHVIVTARTKVAYEVQDGSNGRKAPVKVGLAPVFREGLDYEMTVVLELSIDGHVATSSKDRTGLFDGQYETPSPRTGKKLLDWLTSGVDIADQAMADLEVVLGLDALRQHYATFMDRMERHPRFQEWDAACKAKAQAFEAAQPTQTAPADQSSPADTNASSSANRLQSLYSRHGFSNAKDRLTMASMHLGRQIGSFDELTPEETAGLIQRLENHQSQNREEAA